ncbi:hypothetical protein Mapa_002310 [Marchantia paleacea]|nr:hypothetical protein Mapa_002310 [Marchantia paleacea]
MSSSLHSRFGNLASCSIRLSLLLDQISIQTNSVRTPWRVNASLTDLQTHIHSEGIKQVYNAPSKSCVLTKGMGRPHQILQGWNQTDNMRLAPIVSHWEICTTAPKISELSKSKGPQKGASEHRNRNLVSLHMYICTGDTIMLISLPKSRGIIVLPVRWKPREIA